MNGAQLDSLGVLSGPAMLRKNQGWLGNGLIHGRAALERSFSSQDPPKLPFSQKKTLHYRGPETKGCHAQLGAALGGALGAPRRCGGPSRSMRCMCDLKRASAGRAWAHVTLNAAGPPRRRAALWPPSTRLPRTRAGPLEALIVIGRCHRTLRAWHRAGTESGPATSAP